MGLATSQVRLLALTSRKADVEMQIQLNSKRKTMLTREATELSKLYYAKLQNAKIQYSTTNGYKDVTYDYLMAMDSGIFCDSVLDPTANSTYDKKISNSMIVTDAYGRVILSNWMLDVVANTLNHDNAPGGGQPDDWSVEKRTIVAMNYLLEHCGKTSNGTTKAVQETYNQLLTGGIFNNNVTDGTTDEQKQLGFKVLQHLLRNGYQDGGVLYKEGTGSSAKYYTDYNKTNAVNPTEGVFYIIKNIDDFKNLTDASGGMYFPSYSENNNIVPGLTATVAKQICNMFSYYGAIFSAAFNGNGKGTNNEYIPAFNVAANLDVSQDASGKTTYSRSTDAAKNYGYSSLIQGDNLQNGLKSGTIQLVNVSSVVTGGFSKAQGLDYFKTQNYVVEKADSAERETITAWYNAARADLNTKESYWDAEITALSTELNTITTEIESVKKLREDAISSTFKWGGG